MLKMTAMGGSQFLVENIVFSNIQYAILGQNGNGNSSADPCPKKLDLDRKIQLRVKFEEWIYEFHEKRQATMIQDLESLLAQI